MRVLGLIVLLIAGCTTGRLQPVNECGLPCYPNDSKKAGKGACSYGYWDCDGSEPVCVGFGEPSDEVCDDQDNDCNGWVDDLSQACRNECGYGTQVCNHGVWGDCSARKPQPEICNGQDDDCDQMVDEPTTPTEEGLPSEFCYTGPAGTAALGECHPGAMRCVAGKKYCNNEQLPSPEFCNGRDDDCDGQIDEGASPDGGTLDLMFVIDNSGSMDLSLSSLKTATNTWVMKYQGRTDLRFGVVVAPDPDFNKGYTPRLFQDLTDAQTFAAAVAQMGPTGDGLELTQDAINTIVSSSNPFNISWTVGAKRVIVVYADEAPQCSYPQTPALTGQTAATAGVVVHAFTSNWTDVWSQWQAIVTPSGGTVSDIYGTEMAIEGQLDTIIKEERCQ